MPEIPGARNDTPALSLHAPATTGDAPEGPAAQSSGEGSRKSGDPRAAGATSPRGAQPSGRRAMSDLSARVSPADLEAQLEALGDWHAILDEELAEMAATTKRINALGRRPRNA